MKNDAISATLPAGTYWIGDPCYSVPKDDWDDLLNVSDYFGCGGFGTRNTPPKGVYTFRGMPIAGFNTAYGDGVYEDEQGNRYPVAAGLIGAVPVAYAVSNPVGCRKVTFITPVTVSVDGNGLIRIGDITINTGDDEEFESEESEFSYV